LKKYGIPESGLKWHKKQHMLPCNIIMQTFRDQAAFGTDYRGFPGLGEIGYVSIFLEN
jgi:hypothetical protein